MPKDRRSSSFERCRVSPYSRCYRNADKVRPKSPSPPVGNDNEWEEARCPICMEHPHNAVLLLCSSREKGCRPFMCDTSSRHSNCLDQFRKSTVNADTSEEGTKLVCPLCRGHINGWIVVDPARHFMNSKTRSCSLGTCDFAGNYSELRKHARGEHPFVRPTEIDPEQEFEWRNLEEDMEQQDMLNMQFEFDDVDDDDGMDVGLMDGVYELASPIWDYDLDFQNFLNTFGSEFESVFPEFDWDSGDGSGILDDWDDLLGYSSPNELENREFGRSRGTTRAHNRLPARPSENPATSRGRTNTHRRQRANRQSHRGRPSSHNREEQITTLVDFHELRSNLP